MSDNFHTLADLFAQLGLPTGTGDIERFIRQHQGACRHCALADAPIWTDSQRRFLREAIADDADWALQAEALTAHLR